MAGPRTPEPAGFPNCAICPFREAGSATICFRCASETLPQAAGATCDVCGQELEFGRCGNKICHWSDRGFGRVHVIAMHRDELRDKISLFKHNGMTGWASIFGRIIVGYVNEHEDEMRDYDLIVPNPTYPAGGTVQHTELTIGAAARNDDSVDGWPFDYEPWALQKTQATPRSTNKPWDVKHEFARQHAEAIVVDTDFVTGKRILVYDDVFTTGSTLHFVGLKLQEHGAASVDGLVLARRGWR